MLAFLLVADSSVAQAPNAVTKLSGVYKGKTVFIQNTYNPTLKQFCIQELYVNDNQILFNPNSSAVKLDFEGFDAYIPVVIKIVHKDSICTPVILNPDAITFHSIFSFEKIELSDTTLTWSAKGEAKGSAYAIEKIQGGLWTEEALVESKEQFEGSSYVHYPILETGPNKYRIKYTFPNGEYIYTREIDLHYYPEPVTFKPPKTSRYLYFSRNTPFEIYDAKGAQVLTGIGKEIDLAPIADGNYVIYFDGKDPGSFIKD